MALKLSGSDFTGGGTSVKLDEPGTYPCTLVGASAYLNNKYQSEEVVPQVTLIWDSGYTAENDDGQEVPVLIYDAWLLLSLNEKSNLVKRLTALAGGTLDPETADLELGGINSLDQLTHWKEGRTDVERLVLNGEELFGKEALVTVTINDKGYPKVTGVTAPLKSGKAGGKLKPRSAPAGAPV